MKQIYKICCFALRRKKRNKPLCFAPKQNNFASATLSFASPKNWVDVIITIFYCYNKRRARDTKRREAWAAPRPASSPIQQKTTSPPGRPALASPSPLLRPAPPQALSPCRAPSPPVIARGIHAPASPAIQPAETSLAESPSSSTPSHHDSVSQL
jgi:hypothetical protein